MQIVGQPTTSRWTCMAEPPPYLVLRPLEWVSLRGCPSRAITILISRQGNFTSSFSINYSYMRFLWIDCGFLEWSLFAVHRFSVLRGLLFKIELLNYSSHIAGSKRP
ncbi:hypothetical protein AALP_AAs72626U000100 [Arabis alpina]|uniref:Uncharacterized protein n=1 Tax=Arabis alpina TaxID=50452 RepID=A0A087G1M0_ARAAL|nr:hypothetical protein AALP_AAs72626U000100 [Arabis alpina]